MDKIRYSLFDLFVYALPGGLLLLTANVVNMEKAAALPLFSTIQKSLEEVNVYQATVFIAVAYCTGFITNIAGYYILKLKELIAPVPKPKFSQAGNSEKLTVVRELNKENFRYIEQWNVLKNFSSNLASVIILSCILLYSYNIIHLPALITGIILFVVLIFQASSYHRWSVIDLDNAYKNCKHGDQT